jgi:hypothetical protein
VYRCIILIRFLYLISLVAVKIKFTLIFIFKVCESFGAKKFEIPKDDKSFREEIDKL